MASHVKSGANGKFADKSANDDVLNDGNAEGFVENNNYSPIPPSSLDNRLKRKAKRPSKLIAANENGVGNDANVNCSYPRHAKNSRRSRNGFGRGLPKKGGAGGKGTWGKPGSELMMEEYVADVKDLNYDSQDENQDDCEFEAIAPELTEDDLEKTVDPIIHEYFEHGDTQEVILCLEELNLGKLRPQIISMIVNLAMERKPSHREMTSILLSDMYARILLQEDFAEGFKLLLEDLSDLILDTPDAATVCSYI